MPYNILMIAPTSFFGDYGCHVRILEEARVLQKRGHHVTSVTYFKGRDLPELNIVRTRATPWHADYEVGSSRHKLAFDALLSWTALRTALRLKPDIIHAHLHEGALIGRVVSAITGAPLVFDYQGSLTAEMLDHHFVRPGSKREWFFRTLEHRIDRMPRAILTSSRHSAQLLCESLKDQAHRVVPLPDCVDTDFFRPRTPADQADVNAIKDQLGIPRDRTVIIYLGLLAEYQGTYHIMHAARQIVAARPDAHFLIMGYPNHERFQATAAQYCPIDHLTFTGRVPYEQAARYLRVGDIALAPKLSLTEGAGKILNYMACALPTVAFDTPQAREFMAHFGLYAERGSVEALADRINELLQNPDRAHELGRALRARAVNRFSWDDAARRLLGVYDAIRAPHPELRAAALAQLLEGDHAHEPR
ncbi:MAG TPA: glycosyltransferase family 4 protein [Anaerolineae bacterium]|nr:glycosyltransferase family 4 protein [Anaerolineae bacterium]